MFEHMYVGEHESLHHVNECNIGRHIVILIRDEYVQNWI